MLKKKEIRKIVELSLKASVKEGQILPNQVTKIIKAFKKMSPAEAILALTEYKKGLERIISKHTLQVESMHPISIKELNLIKKTIKTTQPIQQVVYKSNPSLLGGVRITIGDSVIDNSLKTRIREVKEVIAH